MINLDDYTVYDTNNTIIAEGNFTEIEEYLDENGHSIPGYTVVWNYTGFILQKYLTNSQPCGIIKSSKERKFPK